MTDTDTDFWLAISEAALERGLHPDDDLEQLIEIVWNECVDKDGNEICTSPILINFMKHLRLIEGTPT